MIENWKEYNCEHCGLRFMIKQDVEHSKKNTCCPECRNIVDKKK